MTAVLNLLAQNVTILDAVPATGYAGQPLTQLSSGEGGPGVLKSVEDVTALTTAFLGSVGNYARVLRFLNAKVKSLNIYTDAVPDSSATQTLALKFGVAFSDATLNGTPDGTPSAYSGLIPTSANTGATTSFASFASPNNVFGTWTLSGNNLAIPFTDIVFNGAGATYPAISIWQTPLVELFGFTTGQGYNIEQIGYLDVYAYVSVVAATPHAANLLVKMSFCDI